MPVSESHRAIDGMFMWHVRCHFAKHLTDVQTDVHIVPVDSDAQTCNLLILPTTGGALVLYIGTISLRARHFKDQRSEFRGSSDCFQTINVLEQEFELLWCG